MASPDEISAIIAALTSATVESYCETAAAVLFLFDFILTTGEEAEYFWTSPQTGAAVLFYLNRYLNVLKFSDDLGLIGNPSSSNTVCEGVILSNFIIELLPYLVWAVFSALRVLVLCRHSQRWILSLLVAALSLAPIGINLMLFAYGITGTIVGFGTCVASDTVSVTIARQMVIASRTCLLAADCIVIGTTWVALFNRTSFRHVHRHTTLANVLFRDGTIYFLILLVLNALHLTFSLLSIDLPSTENISFFTYFTDTLTAILVQRFLLHLQSANRKALDITSSQGEGMSHTSSVVFDRVVGSLAASLAPEDYWAGDDGVMPDDCVNDGSEETTVPKSITDNVDDARHPA